MTRLSSHLVSCQHWLEASKKKKDRLSQVHELKVMFQHLLKGNYRLTSQRKPLLLSLHLKYRIVPTENQWLRKPWTGLSWVKVFTQGPFQWQRSHVNTFPARRGDFSICKMGCGLEPGSWFQNISLNPRQTLPWGHLIVERSSQSNSQRGLADSQKKKEKKRKEEKGSIYRHIYVFIPIYVFTYLLWVVGFLKTQETSSKSTALQGPLLI